MANAELKEEFVPRSRRRESEANRSEETAPSIDNKAAARPATRKDLIDLHSRILKMITTMDVGLKDVADQNAKTDRQDIFRRLDSMTESVNSLEGAIRIEIAPHLQNVLNEVLDKRNIGTSRRFLSRFTWLFLLGCAFAVGVYASDSVLRASFIAIEYVITFFE